MENGAFLHPSSVHWRSLPPTTHGETGCFRVSRDARLTYCTLRAGENRMGGFHAKTVQFNARSILPIPSNVYWPSQHRFAGIDRIDRYSLPQKKLCVRDGYYPVNPCCDVFSRKFSSGEWKNIMLTALHLPPATCTRHSTAPLGCGSAALVFVAQFAKPRRLDVSTYWAGP